MFRLCQSERHIPAPPIRTRELSSRVSGQRRILTLRRVTPTHARFTQHHVQGCFFQYNISSPLFCLCSSWHSLFGIAIESLQDLLGWCSGLNLRCLFCYEGLYTWFFFITGFPMNKYSEKLHVWILLYSRKVIIFKESKVNLLRYPQKPMTTTVVHPSATEATNAEQLEVVLDSVDGASVPIETKIEKLCLKISKTVKPRQQFLSTEECFY